VVIVTGAARSEIGLSSPYSSSESGSCAVPGEDSRSLPFPLLLLLSFRGAGDGGSRSETSGKCSSSMRVIDARWEPASTAMTEFLDQFVAVDRTRKPVTLSSLGPPPEPC
jgi:hypothetical protein